MSLFTELQAAAFREGLRPGTKKARDWFRQKSRGLTDINKMDVISDERVNQVSRPSAGKMYTFFYDPKTKDSLPYYDTFPLILFVEPAPGGFYGLNLHYLSPTQRAKLFDALLDTANNKKYDRTTKLKINYALLSSTAKYRAFAPTFKRYLTGYVKSNIVEIDAPEWSIAMFLPTESFKKASNRKVWSESKAMF